ncbi:MAG: aspartate/glutamate racemase family protein [Anaerolineaceae bacterium]|nr:aspartate/glutamate racemase family protein [Anaerolineaceae bacterium]
MEKEKSIGVIAGAGPFAGLDLIKKILEQTIATTDQEHFNIISLFKARDLPDRTAFLLDQSLPNPAAAIADQAIELYKMGANVAAIPCNTAHAPEIFNPAMQIIQDSKIELKFLNLIEETVQFIQINFPELKRIGILSTTGTLKTRLYPNILEKVDLQPIVPDMETQESLVHDAIFNQIYGIKAHGTGTPTSRNNLGIAIERLVEAGAEAVILGCTELPLAIPEAEFKGIRMIDPGFTLARALIREVNPKKLKALA